MKLDGIVVVWEKGDVLICKNEKAEIFNHEVEIMDIEVEYDNGGFAWKKFKMMDYSTGKQFFMVTPDPAYMKFVRNVNSK